MAVSELIVDYDDLRRAIAVKLGLDRTPGNWDSDTAADIEAFLEEGLRQFYFPTDPRTGRTHRWSFLFPHKTMTTTAPYSTGNVSSIADGVVAGTGTAWTADAQSWVDQGELHVDGNVYDIGSVSSPTGMTLTDTSVDLTAATYDYEIKRTKYDLPTDFGSIDGPITYGPQTPWYGDIVPIVAEGTIRSWRHGRVAISQQPQWAAIIPDTTSGTSTQSYQLYLWPPADSEYIIWYTYQRNPDNLDGTDKYHFGGTPHGNTVLYSCLSAVEVGLDDEPGPYSQKFQTALIASIDFDQKLSAPDHYPDNPGQMYSTFANREGLARGSLTIGF